MQLISCYTFSQGCYCAHPQILDYQGKKHTAPHTYTAVVAYAVQFFQRGYSAHPQTLDYQGKKHTATHTYTGATDCAAHFLLHILSGMLLCTPTDTGLPRQETHSPPHIYCCSSLRCTVLPTRLLSTPINSELRRYENTQPHTHTLVQ